MSAPERGPREAPQTAGAVRFSDPQIEMSHGAGGSASRRLLDGLIAPLALGDSRPLSDAATFASPAEGGALAITTDSYVVQPHRFPGGSIGSLAVHGTVNDLAVAGASPLVMVTALVLEAGFSSAALEAEMREMARAAHRAGIRIVGGDTKVVENGRGDGLYVTTTGVGQLVPSAALGARNVQVGDRVLVSGPIGDHGITILLARGDLDLEADLESDSRSIAPMTSRLLAELGPAVRWMRDPTRGGVATALNELALDCRLSITLEERRLPVRDPVRGACELLGLDPLHIANEGQFLAVVAAEHAERAVEVAREQGGDGATLIGTVGSDPPGTVLCASPYGGERVVGMLVGDPLPRIC